jgi:uncharacterized membrane protein
LGTLLYAVTGVASSIYFMSVQVTFIHAFCIYCFISAVLTLLLLIAALWHFRATRVDPIAVAKMKAVDVAQRVAVGV